MPRFIRVKDKEGRYTMIEQPIDTDIAVVPVVQPPQPTAIPQVGLKRYACTACHPPKPFGSTGVLAIHFAKKHPELVQDKTSWRAYCKSFGDKE